MKQTDFVWDYRDPYEWMKRVNRGTFPPMIITCAITGGLHGKNRTKTCRNSGGASRRSFEA